MNDGRLVLCDGSARREEDQDTQQTPARKLVWLTEKGKSWVRAAIMQHVDTSFRIG